MKTLCEKCKPCPLCGCEKILVNQNKTTIIECSNCGASVFEYQDGKRRDPIETWNARLSKEANWEAIDKHIGEYIADYVMEGDSGSYMPTDQERFLIEDAIAGLLADEAFLRMLKESA